MTAAPRFLILETSHRLGWVALGQGDRIVGQRLLEESRRHARDLVPFTRELLTEQGWTPRNLDGVIVGLGPGSYTGLRVGIISAKTLAYATGCVLLGIETFAAIAHAAPLDAHRLEVIADAQQDKIYVQPFEMGDLAWRAAASLVICPFAEWAAGLGEGTMISGPGLEKLASRFPAHVRLAPERAWRPAPANLLALGLERFRRGERDDPFALEPIYLRPSSAEEKWDSLGRSASG